MRSSAGAVLCLALSAACTPRTLLDKDVSIQCDEQADCPSPRRCNFEIRRCYFPSENQAPSVTIHGLSVDFDAVTLTLVVTDPNAAPYGADAISLTVLHADLSNPEVEPVWQPATAGAGSSQLDEVTQVGASHLVTFAWDLLADAGEGALVALDVDTDGDGVAEGPGLAYAAAVGLKIEAVDKEGATAVPALTGAFELGNTPPVTSLGAPTAPVAGDVPLLLTVADPASDLVALEIELRSDEASPWHPAAIVSGALAEVDTSPTGREHVVVFGSRTLPPAGVGNTVAEGLQIRVRAYDEPAPGVLHHGPWLSPPVVLPTIVNQTPPRAAGLEAPRLLLRGGSAPLPLQYRAIDAESDPVDVRFSYSTDGGKSFAECIEYADPRSEGRHDLASAPDDAEGQGGVWHTFFWDPTGALMAPSESILVRLEVSDGNGEIFGLETSLAGNLGPPGLEPHDSPFVEQAYGSLPGARRVLAADLTGDALPDLVVAASAAAIGILAQEPDGSFAPAADVDLPDDTAARLITAADFDEDGDLDLAVAHHNSVTTFTAPSAVLVLEAQGGGAFEPASTYGVPDYPVALEAADADGDGVLDLVAAVSQGHQLVVLRGNDDGEGRGDGSFTPASYDTSPDSAARWPTGLVLHDFDGDGHLDAALTRMTQAVTSALNDLVVMRGVGDGSFQPLATRYLVGLTPMLLVGFDANDDGARDLVAANYSSQSLTVLEGVPSPDPDGVWFVRTRDYVLPSPPRDLAYGDLGGDGIEDLLLVSVASTALTVVPGVGTSGVGTGSFGEPFALDVGGETGELPASLTAVQLDAGGTLDLLVSRSSADSVAVFSGAEGAGFGAGSFVRGELLGTGVGPRVLALPDLDADGALDLASLAAESGELRLSYAPSRSGVVTGGLVPTTHITTAGTPMGMACADLDADGLGDVAVAAAGDDAVTLYKGSAGYVASTPLPVAADPVALVAADVEADGDQDLVVLSAGGCEITVLGNDGAAVFFETDVEAIPDCSGVDVAGGLVVLDFDRDGVPDIAGGISGLNVWHGNGDGSFELLPTAYPVTGAWAVAAGDFNGDGLWDVAAGNSFLFVEVLLGKDDGGSELFEAPVGYASQLGIIGLAAADLDGDAVSELLVTGGLANRVQVLKGNAALGRGDGTFAAAVSYEQRVGRGAAAVADADGDGLLDVAFSSASLASAALLLAQLETYYEVWHRPVEPWQPTAPQAIAMVGEVWPAQLDRFGAPRRPAFSQHVQRVAAGDAYSLHELRRQKPALPPHLEVITAPWRVVGDERLTRLADGRLRAEPRLGPKGVAGVPLGLDGEARAVVVPLPVLDAFDPEAPGTVRVFLATTDLERDPAAPDLLPRDGESDRWLPAVTWWEVSPGAGAPDSTPGRGFWLDASTRRILVRTERLGVLQAFFEPSP